MKIQYMNEEYEGGGFDGEQRKNERKRERSWKID